MNTTFIIYWPSMSIYRFECYESAFKFRQFLGMKDATIIPDEVDPRLKMCRDLWSL